MPYRYKGTDVRDLIDDGINASDNNQGYNAFPGSRGWVFDVAAIEQHNDIKFLYGTNTNLATGRRAVYNEYTNTSAVDKTSDIPSWANHIACVLIAGGGGGGGNQYYYNWGGYGGGGQVVYTNKILKSNIANITITAGNAGSKGTYPGGNGGNGGNSIVKITYNNSNITDTINAIGGNGGTGGSPNGNADGTQGNATNNLTNNTNNVTSNLVTLTAGNSNNGIGIDYNTNGSPGKPDTKTNLYTNNYGVGGNIKSNNPNVNLGDNSTAGNQGCVKVIYLIS